jgi:peptide chain release factor 1
MATIEQLVEDVDRSYQETQERMSNPAIYNDHREAAEVGRRLKELEGAHNLAQEWRAVRADLDAARADGELRELIPELEQRVAQLEQELKLALVETDPAER